MRYLKLYLRITGSLLTAIDMLWLGLVARSFYQQHLGFWMAPRPNWLVAIVFYLLFNAGLLVFVVLPLGWELTLSKQPYYAQPCLGSLPMPLTI